MEVRIICCNLALQDQIRDLGFEKDRLKKRYSQSKKEIDDKIKYCERELAKAN
tara:strand:- start:3431 stop:3589 length:159 start_codon:yes stop_codon:yes gene_type:complete